MTTKDIIEAAAFAMTKHDPKEDDARDIAKSAIVAALRKADELYSGPYQTKVLSVVADQIEGDSK